MVKMRIPVVGVFYNEVTHVDGWLSSIAAQQTPDLEPVPVMVVGWDPTTCVQLRASVERCAADRRVERRFINYCETNVGHTGGFCLGAQTFVSACDESPWIASLDPDARFAPGALSHLLEAAQRSLGVGFVSPIVVQPRATGDFDSPAEPAEIVCHTGHFPFEPREKALTLTNFWWSHFLNEPLSAVQQAVAGRPDFEPFAACFCAALWSARMFHEIGLPDSRQFRTLNCGEVCYRARLSGWSGRLASSAFAFHPNAKADSFQPSRAVQDPSSGAWHYFHAQGLIALRYFPDHIRDVAALRNGIAVPWNALFDDLAGISPDVDQAKRLEMFSRWNSFRGVAALQGGTTV